MTKKPRQPKLIAICGTNGTGKTYLTKNELLPKSKSDYLVIDNDNMESEWHSLTPVDLKNPREVYEKKKAYACHKWFAQDGKEAFWKYIYHNVHDRVLVLDDCRDYIPPNIDAIPFLRNCFSRRRQKMLDIIIIQHSVADIPKGLIKYLNSIILFNTDDTPQDIATRLNHKWLVDVANDIQLEARNNPHTNRVIDLKNLRA